jgi:single-strand DNA-binding protein
VEGNLIKDPVFKETPKGVALCTFSLASNRYYKKAEDQDFTQEVSYFDVTTWARLAETCRDYGHKGRSTRVVGRLKQERWTDGEGRQRDKIVIIAEHVEFRPEVKKAPEESKEPELTATAE